MAEKLFYSMGEVAELFDVNKSLIRHWESQFAILRPKRNKKGNRLFSPEDVENLKVIYHLVKERGMTLEGAKKALRKAPAESGVDRDAELMERLQHIRALLTEVREDLKAGAGEIVGGTDADFADDDSAADATLAARGVAPAGGPAAGGAVSGKGAVAGNGPSAATDAADAADGPADDLTAKSTADAADGSAAMGVSAVTAADGSAVIDDPAAKTGPDADAAQSAGEEPAGAPVRRRRAKAVVKIDEATGEEITDGANVDGAGQPAPKRAARKPRRKKEEVEHKELFAFYEQSLF